MQPSNRRPVAGWQQQMNQQSVTYNNQVSSQGGVASVQQSGGPSSITSASSNSSASSSTSVAVPQFASAGNMQWSRREQLAHVLQATAAHQNQQLYDSSSYCSSQSSIANANITSNLPSATASPVSSSTTSGPSSFRSITSTQTTSSSDLGELSRAKATQATSTNYLSNNNNSSSINNTQAANNNNNNSVDYSNLIMTLMTNGANGSINDEQSRKLRLQLYVFVLRCISYPFNAKQADLNSQRHQQIKLKLSQLEQIIQLHTRYVATLSQGNSGANLAPNMRQQLNGGQLSQLEEAYTLIHEEFNRKYLQTQRLRALVESQCCSQWDLRDLFRACIERHLSKCNLFSDSQQQQQQQQSQPSSQSNSRNSSKRQNNNPSQQQVCSAELSADSASASPLQVNSLPATKETLINSWLIKFEQILRGEGDPSEPSSDKQQSGNVLHQQLTKDQLYQMFQNILNIKKFEHQLLYNALQLDSSDEQAAAIRRELDGRIAKITEIERNKSLAPKFVLKDMEQLFFEELRYAVNRLMINLDSLPVMKSNSGNVLALASSGLASGAGHASNAANSANNLLTSDNQTSANSLLSSGAGSQQAPSSSSSAVSNATSRVSYGFQKFRRYNSSR